jgi:cytochrome c biogenesis protein CcdA
MNMELFRSKRFWTMIVGVLAMAITALVPALAEQIEYIAPSIVIIIGILIGGYSAEDVALARNQKH